LYALKQLVATLASPLVIAAVLLVLGLILRRRAGRCLATPMLVAAGLTAWLGSTPLIGTLLLMPLEGRFSTPDPRQLAGVRHIVVLGSFYAPVDGIPITSALDDEGTRRVNEALRLRLQIPEATLVMCGGAPPGVPAPSAGSARLARELGVDESAIRQLPGPLDTAAEARQVAQLLGAERFVLVTSAVHMPRAMEYFRRAGAQPIAAPTAHRGSRIRWHWRSVLPNADGLRNTELALHEYLGLLAQWIS
jgi:uncharacterized SAM-binding protein YcdF (DUF218 family)